MALSQEQINALLEGTGTFDEENEDPSGLSGQVRDFFLHFSKIAMEAGSTAISQALGKTVSIAHPEISTLVYNDLKSELSPAQVLIQTGYNLDTPFESLLLLKDYDVAVIFDILMGKDGRNPDLEIGDLQISAIGEVMNQLIGAAATALSKEFERKVAMKAPESILIQLDEAHNALPQMYKQKTLLQLKYHLVIEGILDSEFYELRLLEKGQELHQALTAAAEPAPPPAPMPPHAPQAPAPAAPPMAAPASTTAAYHAPAAPQIAPTQAVPPPAIRQAEFSQLTPGQVAASGSPNLDRIVDIPLRVTVELGNTKIKIKDVLDLAKGSVVELDKIAGEAVDMMVNGKLMAKGEVVVVNDNFGLRITEILGPSDRLRNLSE